MKILVVDDEVPLLRLLRVNLEASGYEVLVATDGAKAVEVAAREQPHLVLLDVLMPEMDGFEACRRIREFSQVPIIMLTAKAREQDKLTGFEAGADDYLTKPFSVKELLARIKAVLRRGQTNGRNGGYPTLQVGGLCIDRSRHRVSVQGREVRLTPTEFKLLSELAAEAGKVVSHRDLLRRVWGPEYGDEVEYLRVYVSHLRRKIEPDPDHPQYLLTVPGVGYVLACPE